MNELEVFVDAGQAISSEEVLLVALQEAPIGRNGTRIFSSTGAPLEPTDIFINDSVMIDGVLILDTPDFLRAALILVDVERADEVISSGVVTRVFADGFEIEIEGRADPSSACQNEATLDVLTSEATRRLTVTIDEAGSMTTIGSLVIRGDEVTVTGQCNADGLEANVVLIIDDQRSMIEVRTSS